MIKTYTTIEDLENDFKNDNEFREGYEILLKLRANKLKKNLISNSYYKI